MVSEVRYFSFKEIQLHSRQPFRVLVAIIVVLKLVIAQPQVMLFAGDLAVRALGADRWVAAAHAPAAPVGPPAGAERGRVGGAVVLDKRGRRQ